MPKKKKIRLSKRGKITLLVASAMFFLIIGTIIYFKTRPLVVFREKSIEVEINGDFDVMGQVKKTRKGEITEVTADISQIDFTKLGKYEALYTYHDKTYSLDVEIVDTIAPEFEVKEGTTDAKVEIDPKTLVYDIQDATNTTVSLKDDYDFDKEGTIEVVVVVTDEANNSTEKSAKVKILPEDKTKPEMSGEKSITLQKGSSFEPLESVSIKDNQDPHPIINIKNNNVNTKEIGKYKVEYEGIDRSGNKTSFVKEVNIVERTEIGRSSGNGENIVYLTFDDGPSYNTPKILDILDKYHVKATFFVTGNGKDYNDCIKRAYDAGHTIGLHTYSHDYEKVYSSKQNYFEDLNAIGDMVEEITGHRPHYIRFPGGSSNTVSKNYKEGIMSALSQEVIDRGYQYYDWNLSSSDASGNNVNVDKIIKSATNDDSGNLVILFHDAKNKDTTVEALPVVIEYYQKLGFKFMAITDESYTCHHGINN